MRFKGKAFVFGDNVNTDDIIPARYLNSTEPEELARHLMEDVQPGFGRRGDLEGAIIVAGENFGCGSSREHAPLAIKASGISCVIARSFARIFLRNAVNIGLPVIELETSTEIRLNDQIDVNLEGGTVMDITQNREHTFKACPDFLNSVFKAGGWISYLTSEEKTIVDQYLQEIAQFQYKHGNIKL